MRNLIPVMFHANHASRLLREGALNHTVEAVNGFFFTFFTQEEFLPHRLYVEEVILETESLTFLTREGRLWKAYL